MKRLLFFLVFLSMSSSLVQAQKVMENREPTEGLSKLPKERVFVHYNASFLLTGEYLYYQVYCIDSGSWGFSDLSKVAYVELVGKSGEVVFRQKIILDHGLGGGDFFIPTTVPSGVYKLLGYTNWMRNGQFSDFFQADVTIVNPYREDLGQLQPSSTIKKDTLQKYGEESQRVYVSNETNSSVLSNSFQISLNKQYFGKREKVSFSLNSDMKGRMNGNYSVSVRKIDGVLPPTQPSFADFKEIGTGSENSKEYAIVNHEVFLPELRGELFQGRVEALKEGSSIGDLKVAVSIPGEDYYFYVARTDTNGEFYFNVDSSYSGNQLVFQVLGKNPGDYKIGLKEPSPLEYSKLEFNPNPLLPEFRQEILQRSIHNQIENSYFQFRPDSVQTLDTKQIFDSKEKVTYLLDDYTRFKTVSETLLEIIKDVSTERIAKDQYLIRVKGYDYASPSGNLPLILMDGQIITDHDALLNFDARNIEEIRVLRHEFIIGPEQFQGAMIINTKNGNGYTSFQNANDSSIVEIFNPEARKNYFVQRYDNGKTDSRLPDDRMQLLWLPHKRINENETDFDFFTSDVPGIFEIRIEGLTDENLPVSVRKTFTVE